MLYKTKGPAGKTMHKTKPLLITAKEGYSRPDPGKAWFQTTTTVWRVDEIIRRRVRDWRRLLGETGHTGTRTETMRADHDSVYTGTHSVFPAPLVEWVLLRYGPPGSRILDAFAGGPPRAVVAAIMGYEYVGFDIRQEQIDENLKLLTEMGLQDSVDYYLGDGCLLSPAFDMGKFDVALTCPPYWNLEKYSDLPNDLSNATDYPAFNRSMRACAEAHVEHMKPGAFVCIVVGPFRDKKGELIDFPAHTVKNFQDAGFIYWQQIVLSKNFASAAKRSTNAWKGHKLVPAHEFLLVFRTPQ
jgi:DNA modification methylase